MDARVAHISRFYETFVERDWDGMRALFADDAQLGISGRSPFAGEHHGVEAAVGVLRDMVERRDGTLAPVRPDTWDICISDHHVILFEWLRAERQDRKLRAYLYLVHSSEQYEFDEFWS
jgi:ketosteroid isomerase-like protein